TPRHAGRCRKHLGFITYLSLVDVETMARLSAAQGPSDLPPKMRCGFISSTSILGQTIHSTVTRAFLVFLSVLVLSWQ
ncbi:hypothetical protein BDN72DRAFT_835683, partial [Pluteus cervinus]